VKAEKTISMLFTGTWQFGAAVSARPFRCSRFGAGQFGAAPFRRRTFRRRVDLSL